MSFGLSNRIKEYAASVGFDLCGIAPVADFRELNVFPDWIAAGKHGDMKYMEGRDESGKLKRAALRRVAPWARSVIVCAINYNTAPPYSTAQPVLESGERKPSLGWISRYAWGREDYHDAVLRRLRQMETKLGDLAFPNENNNESLQLRSYVDTGPLIERVYAKYAGIGWIAKNTCIINQQLGSWLFLGVILTSIDLAEHGALFDLPAPDRCGTCTRCIAACPTQAIVAPGELDARLCISYLTIEKRGEIPEAFHAPMGRHIFGCDICQDVCPWNRRAPVTSAAEFEPRAELVNPPLEWLAAMSPEQFATEFRGSPVKRAKRSGIRRNAVIAMGNSANSKFLPVLSTLAEDADPMIAQHARWAKTKLAGSLDRNS